MDALTALNYHIHNVSANTVLQSQGHARQLIHFSKLIVHMNISDDVMTIIAQ